MKCTVLLFARYGELAGAPRIEVDVRDGATLGEIWDRVRERVPALSGEENPLLACERSYARPDRVVSPGEEIAVFPPVSGG